MVKRVFLDGQLVILDTSTTLGMGGQASVLKYKDQALKLWHQPDPRAVRKVSEFIKRPPGFPKEIILPNGLVTDSNGEVIGYSMPLLPNDFHEVPVFFNKKLRRNLNISLPDVLKRLDHGQRMLTLVNSSGILVGDLSGRNVAFSQKDFSTYWYDTDSWVAFGYPCPVFTQDFVDPKILSRIHQGTIPFDQSTDEYSFSLIVFWSIFFSHPFGGDHPLDQIERSVKGIWVFDPSVERSSITQSPEVVDDNLLDYFESIFVKGRRLKLPDGSLLNLSKALVRCSSCNHWYSNTRKVCPNCSHKTPLGQLDLIALSNLISLTEPIRLVKFQSQKLFVISGNNQSGLKLTVVDREKKQLTIPLPDFPPGTQLDIAYDHILVVGDATTDEISLFDFTSGNLIFLSKTSTNRYLGNRRLVFRGTATGILRLTNTHLVSGVSKGNYLLDTTLPVETLKGQTLFWTDPNLGITFGLIRLFDTYQFWIHSQNGRYDLLELRLLPGQTMLDLSVKFSSKSVLLRRIVQENGKRYLYTNIISLTGENLFQLSGEFQSLGFNDIHGCAYDHGVVFHPTDRGILAEDIFSQTTSVVPKTTKVVTAQDRLVHLGGRQHFLILRDQSVDYLILK